MSLAVQRTLDDPDGIFADVASRLPSGAVFDNERIIESAVAHFRASGFPYRRLPVHVCMQQINDLATTESASLIGSHLGYAVADTYHPHRFHGAAHGMRSPLEAYNDEITLRRAIRLTVEQERFLPEGFFDMLKFSAGTQACSNFRPGFAAWLYRKWCKPGDTVLDTSTGYGGRLVGYMASNVNGRYVGIDPSQATYEGNLRMAFDLGFAEQVELYDQPAEDVPHAALAGRCDFAFTSPPYYRKERYADEPTQSSRRYRTGEDWRRGFLEPTFRLQFAALKHGCHSAFNVADVTFRGRRYPLVEWSKEAALAAGFAYVRTDLFPLTRRFGVGQSEDVAHEPILIFRKPTKEAS